MGKDIAIYKYIGVYHSTLMWGSLFLAVFYKLLNACTHKIQTC